MKQYANLKELLKEDPRAAALFAELPRYARDQITSRSGHVNSLLELEGYVNNILRGDN